MDKSVHKDRFVSFLGRCGLDPQNSESLHNKFTTYERILREWSGRFNLISEGDLDKLWVRHFEDALKPLEFFPGLNYKRVVDVGSGAGLPGLAVALALPGAQVTLIDSTQKKCAFLVEAASALGLGNVDVQCERAETLGQHPAWREKFDSGLTRALAKPAAALELVLPFVKPSGHAFFWGGRKDWEDSGKIGRIATLLSSRQTAQKGYVLEEGGLDRQIAAFEKTAPLSSRYPRKPGIPAKKPLDS